MRAKATYTLTTKQIEGQSIRESVEPPSSDGDAPLVNPSSETTTSASSNGAGGSSTDKGSVGVEGAEVAGGERSEVVANGDPETRKNTEDTEVVANGDATNGEATEVANGDAESGRDEGVPSGSCATVGSEVVASDEASSEGCRSNGDKMEDGEADSGSAVVNGVPSSA